VRDALIAAADLVAQDLQFSERPEIDYDIKDEPGLAEIARTIFRKIDESALFVADVTSIAMVGKKAVLNPNVAIELGYAARALDWPHLILVANRAWGWDFDHLPFDLKHRAGTIDYDLPEGADEVARAAVLSDLVERLKIAIIAGLRNPKAAQQPATVALTQPEIDRRLAWEGERILSVRNAVGYTYDAKMLAEPRLFAAIRPAHSDLPSRGKVVELMRAAGLWGMWTSRNGASSRLDTGAITFGTRELKHPLSSEIEHLIADGSEWFSDRGEIRLFIQLFNHHLAPATAPTYWAYWLIKAPDFFQSVNARGPFHVELSVTRLKTVMMFGSWHNQEVSAIDEEVRIVESLTDFSDDQIVPLLVRAEERLADAYHLDPEPQIAMDALAKVRQRGTI
jgi:hypothetical protein